MVNFKTIFKNGLPLTPKFLVKTLQNLCNKIVIEQSKLDAIALMANGSDITSLFGVTNLVEIARCIKSRGEIFIEDDTGSTLTGGITSPLSTWTLCNEGTDVSVAIGWIDKSGESIIYHGLEMYVKYSTNKVILADAFYKML